MKQRMISVLLACFMLAGLLVVTNTAFAAEADNTSGAGAYKPVTLKGEASTNVGNHDYTVRASTVDSYLTQQADGTLAS